jgi:hypothetical protein
MLAALATKLPFRPVGGREGAYLSRYTLAELPDGGFAYLHFFHRSDVDRELHNHPWAGESLILTGGYREERRMGEPGAYRVETRTYQVGDVNVLGPDTFHRVDLLDEAAGCWTLFVAGERTHAWGFWDPETDVFTPLDEMKTARKGLVSP